MPSFDNTEKRKQKRRGHYREIEGVFQDSPFYATIQNISIGGMCFDVDYLFRTGMDLRLRFRVFDSDQQTVEVNAVVMWVQPLHMVSNRVGVRFTGLDRKAEHIIGLYASGLKIESEEYVSGVGKYPLLSSPFNLSNVTLKNHLVMAPMFWGYANIDGTVSQLLIDHYREIALGGVSMIVAANAVIDRSGIMVSRVLRIDHDRFIPGLANLAEAIKSSGAVACLQINHAGRWAEVDKSMAPSPTTVAVQSELGVLHGIRKELKGRHQMRLVTNYLSSLKRCRQGMTLEEIESIKESYGQAALRACKAGFDMVELHGASGYLLVQFLSPRSNKRSDSYGGNLENRMRFPLEVVETVKDYTTNDFPVGYRFMADEWLANGFNIEEACIFAQNLEKRNIAYLSVTAGTHESFFLQEIMNRSRKEGFVIPLAKRVKEAVSVTPVIAAGRIVRPSQGEDILRNNEADLIGLARPLFVDPMWPKKVFEGNEGKIVSCACCNTCLFRVIMDKPAICARWDRLKKMDIDIRLKKKRSRWENILIAMNNSEGSLQSVEYAGFMIGRGKKVVLFSVLTSEIETESAGEKIEGLMAQAKILLQNAGMNESDIEIKVTTVKKGVAEDILEEISKGEYGSVVLGKGRASKSRQLLFGTTSDYIAHHAKDCGVWIID